MFLLVSILKGFAEIALLCLIGQGLMFLFAGATRAANPIYRLFQIANRPAWRLTRFIAPKRIIDAHIGVVSLFVLLLIWVLLTAAKISLYLPAR